MTGRWGVAGLLSAWVLAGCAALPPASPSADGDGAPGPAVPAEGASPGASSEQELVDLRAEVTRLRAENAGLAEGLAGAGPQYVPGEVTNEEAADRLAAFLDEVGFDAERVDADLVKVETRDGASFMAPRIIPGHLSRIVVIRFLAIKPRYVGSPEVLAWVTYLNQRLNNAAYYFSEDYDALVIRSAVEFVERLSLEEVLAFMEYWDTGIGVMLLTVPETLKYLDQAEGV